MHLINKLINVHVLTTQVCMREMYVPAADPVIGKSSDLCSRHILQDIRRSSSSAGFSRVEEPRFHRYEGEIVSGLLVDEEYGEGRDNW